MVNQLSKSLIVFIVLIFAIGANAEESSIRMITKSSQIGTVDHPTIDGAFNDATKKDPINVLVHKNTSSEKSLSKMNDAWASDKRVQRLLESAARNGKLDYVLKKSKNMGLPASVALLPMIESNYSTNAISNKGAAGAWQLMPTTAKDYGLSLEGRYQFTASTDAALALISDLHHQFGNWELTFAAYNAGSQRISNAKAKNPYAQSFNELALPRETKTYINRMIALNNTLAGLS